jgi:hypothetical protein
MLSLPTIWIQHGCIRANRPNWLILVQAIPAKAIKLIIIIVSCTYRGRSQIQDRQGGLYSMGEEEKEQKEPMIHEEDEYGNILIYPNWSKTNAPKDQQSKWEVPIYM